MKIFKRQLLLGLIVGFFGSNGHAADNFEIDASRPIVTGTTCTASDVSVEVISSSTTRYDLIFKFDALVANLVWPQVLGQDSCVIGLSAFLPKGRRLKFLHVLGWGDHPSSIPSNVRSPLDVIMNIGGLDVFQSTLYPDLEGTYFSARKSRIGSPCPQDGTVNFDARVVSSLIKTRDLEKPIPDAQLHINKVFVSVTSELCR